MPWLLASPLIAPLIDSALRRDESRLFHSAIGYPQNKLAYSGIDDIALLAGYLMVAIAGNHGFEDGNKRTGYAAALMFLDLNGFQLELGDDTSVGKALEMVLNHSMDEDEFVEIFVDGVAPKP